MANYHEILRRSINIDKLSKFRRYLLMALQDENFNVNEPINSTGVTLLHGACFVENIEAVRLLVENGADVNSVDIDGDTPLHDAAVSTRTSLSVLSYLISNGADPLAKNSDNNTPLSYARYYNKDKESEYLEAVSTKALMPESGCIPKAMSESLLSTLMDAALLEDKGKCRTI